LTEKAIRRGSFVSVPDLKQAIEAFIQAWKPKPQAVHLERHRRGHPQKDRSRAGQDGAHQTRIHPTQGEKEDS
jgi:hypothetical protein